MTIHDTAIRPFSFHAYAAQLDALRSRLQTTRFPEAETVAGADSPTGQWSQGAPLRVVQDLARYWASAYDWRAFERKLCAHDQYTTTIDGLSIHFLHRRSSRADAVPLVLTHGWPGSIVEFIDLLDELADPSDTSAPAFHVVAPSLPGFGFSGKPETTGWGTERIAAAWVHLMSRLGYERFLAHGGDWGGVITTLLGGRFPDHAIGIHTTFAEGPPDLPADGLDDDAVTWAEQTRRFQATRLAYAKVQATQPQTIGYGLVDSPVALLAWILDKFAEWTDTADSPFEVIPMDVFLDNVTLYWLTASGASAARIYYESHNALDPALQVHVPTAVTTYPGDISKTPRAWAEERFHRIVHWVAPDAGGHFPSLERPTFFLNDLRAGLSAVMDA